MRHFNTEAVEGGSSTATGRQWPTARLPGEETISRHANTRSAQRNLRQEDLDYVLAHGSRLRRTGVIFVYLRKRDIPTLDLRTQRARLEGTVIILGYDGGIVTAYHSRDKRAGYHLIRAKAKFRRPMQDTMAMTAP